MNKFGAVPTQGFRSKLEKYCWDALRKHKIRFEYEPKKFVLLPGFDWPHESLEKVGKKLKHKKKVRPVHYIPDFVGDGWIIETKGVRTAAFNIKWKMFKHYLLENNLEYDLYAPSNNKEVDYVVNLIKEKY